jgi:hypothetical protein
MGRIAFLVGRSGATQCATRDEPLTLDLWVYAAPSCLVADSATGGNASRHRERQVPFLRALATAPGSGAIGSALVGAVWPLHVPSGRPRTD